VATPLPLSAVAGKVTILVVLIADNCYRQ